MRQDQEIGIGIITFMQKLADNFPPGLGPVVDRVNGLVIASEAFDLENPIVRSRELFVAKTDELRFEQFGDYPAGHHRCICLRRKSDCGNLDRYFLAIKQ